MNQSSSSSAFAKLPPFFSVDAFARWLPLALLMLATRFYHIGSAWHLPDASWAIFFLGGFYLRPAFFALLAVEAVAIDFTFFAMGGSTYCLSSAYGFQLPAFAALWFGGYQLVQQGRRDWRFFAIGVRNWWLAASVAYVLTNGSFYWLSGKFVDLNWATYAQNFSHWYAAFISRPMLYLVLAAIMHAAMTQAQRARLALR